MTTNHIPTIKRWHTHPDRESLRVIYRFLDQQEGIENVSLEPHRTHPRLVRATVTDRASSTTVGILEIRWYETRDFTITCQMGQTDDSSPLLRWTHSSNSEETIVSHSRSDDVRTLSPPSHHLRENRFHPLRVISLVLATIEDSGFD